jgi:hypothetical protein
VQIDRPCHIEKFRLWVSGLARGKPLEHLTNQGKRIDLVVIFSYRKLQQFFPDASLAS